MSRTAIISVDDGISDTRNKADCDFQMVIAELLAHCYRPALPPEKLATNEDASTTLSDRLLRASERIQ